MIKKLLLIIPGLFLYACAQADDPSGEPEPTSIEVFDGFEETPADETDYDTDEVNVDSGFSDIIPGSIEDFVTNVGNVVYFDFDVFELSYEATVILDAQVAWLNTYQNVTLTVEGHADERGTREYNLALGEKRASSVRNYLIAQGLESERIETISYGEERPAELGSDEFAWSRNRRAVSGSLTGAN